MSAPGQLVVFGVASGRYAVPVAHVVEVIQMVALTPVPHPSRRPGAASSPDPAGELAVWRETVHPAGLVDVRGRVLPVYEMRGLLDLPREEPTTATRILILQAAERAVGIIVDHVEGVAEPAPDSITEATEGPARSGGMSHVYRDSLGLVLVIDPAELLALDRPRATPRPSG